MTSKEEVASAKSTCMPPMEPLGTPSYAEWAMAYQAYYGSGTSSPYPCFFPAVAVASGPHQSQPYHWGGQPLMGPYGNTVFPCTTYPYGYTHPTLAAGALPYNPYAMPSPSTELVMAAPMAETDAKSSIASGARQSKGGISMMAAVGSDETTKVTSSSASGTGGFSDGSEEEGTPNEFETTSKASFSKSKKAGKCGARTTTHLNGGTDHWSQSTRIGLQGKLGSADLSATSLPSQPMVQCQDGVRSDMWCKDDKETKRQKRKQSNRESARRSRLRKQAECGELSTRVDSLMAENTSLRTELDRLSAECKKLLAENATIVRRMQCYEGEENEPGDKQQAMQLEEVGSVEGTSFKRRSIFHLPNDIRTTSLHDLGACALSLMGQTDSVVAS